MQLRTLLRDIEYDNKGGALPDCDVVSISANSKQLERGALFVALKGEQSDGHDFVGEAAKKGACALVVARPIATPRLAEHLPIICVPDTRRVYGELAAVFFQHPSRAVKVVGVTGTNGKTTTTLLLCHILNTKQATGHISTITYNTQQREIPATHTTPDAYCINQLLAEMHTNNCSYCVMEVSSHALSQERVWGIDFDGAIFTNLSQDHLDYHHTMEEYFQAKALLFTSARRNQLCIINADDAYGQRLGQEAGGVVFSYGIDMPADCRAEDVVSTADGSTFTVRCKDIVFPITSKLTGKHNVYNILAACAYAYQQGISPAAIQQSVNTFPGVRGRLEPVYVGQPFKVFIDYAHTPDAFVNIFRAVKKLCQGKIFTVFGCGGNRDQAKRPQMGAAAATYSDYVIITTDNPRFENERHIVTDIEEGIEPRAGFTYEIILDRRRAIQRALQRARAGDMVLILGKGHEEYIIKKNKKYAFSDRAVATEILTKEFSRASIT